jgi:hypothetical protein
MLERPVQLLNAQTLIVFMLEGIVTEVKPLHELKAFQPILVTLEGMVMLVKPEQPEKA